MSNPVLVVVGAGPGVGGHVASRFAAEGYDVALVSRGEAELAELAGSIARPGGTVVWDALDITDAPALAAAVTSYGERFGRIDVLHFNPSAFRQKDPLTLDVAELLDDVALGVGALLTAVQAARPFLGEGGRVTVTGSGAADSPWHEAASLGVQKAGLRNLVLSLDRALSPAGIRAVSVTVHGTLAAEGPFHPALVADRIWDAAHQPVESWQAEVPYRG